MGDNMRETHGIVLKTATFPIPRRISALDRVVCEHRKIFWGAYHEDICNSNRGDRRNLLRRTGVLG